MQKASFALLAGLLAFVAAGAANAADAGDCPAGTINIAADDGGADCLPLTSGADGLCAVDQIGSSCGASGGTCITATCTEDEGDGAVYHGACGACVVLPSNYCTDVGLACGDAGTCVPSSTAGGGGSTSGGPTSGVGYDVPVCEVITDAGPALDAGTLGNTGGGTGTPDASTTAIPEPDASTTSVGGPKDTASPSSSSSSNGCTVAAAVGVGGAGGAWLALGAIALGARRRKRSA